MTERQQKQMGERIARLRDAAGMTNESLAREANLSTKTVSRLVNGKHEARIATIEAVAKALKVPEREIRGAPPSPFSEAGDSEVMARVERRLAAHAKAVEDLIEKQNRLLIEQSDVLRDIRAATSAQRVAAERFEEASRLMESAGAMLQEEALHPAPSTDLPETPRSSDRNER